ncbi:Methyl-CpG-binding domain-containing protein [Dirofilaria immitis]
MQVKFLNSSPCKFLNVETMGENLKRRWRVNSATFNESKLVSKLSFQFFVEYKKLEVKDEVEEQKGKINNDEFFTDVKSSEYCDINILQLPSSLESKVIVMEPTLRMAPKFLKSSLTKHQIQ